MYKRKRAEPCPDAAPVLLDIGKKMRLVSIPHIEHTEADPFRPGATFQEIQTRAWWMYLRSKAANCICPEDDVHNLPVDEAIEWIDHLLAAAHDDGFSIARIKSDKFVPLRTLQRVERAVPGSAGVYFWGPDFSSLWSALSGQDDGQAMARLMSLTGLTFAEISACENKFIDVLLRSFEPIALHATAAMIAMLGKQGAGQGLVFPQALNLLHAATYSRLQDKRRISDDPEVTLILDNPWYQKALTCVHHNATVGRLMLYGLSRDDIFLVRGTPTLEAPNKKGFEFSVRSDVIDVITFERGDIPYPIAMHGALPQEESRADRLTLAEFARHWYEMTPERKL